MSTVIPWRLEDHANGGVTNEWYADDIMRRVQITRSGTCFTDYHNVTAICQALEQYAPQAIAGKRGLVLGSQSPWAESILLAHNALHVTTLEYQKSSCIGVGLCGNLSIIHPARAAKDYVASRSAKMQRSFDFAFSYSSYEHDGLGRYGDPINPVGDLSQFKRCVAC